MEVSPRTFVQDFLPCCTGSFQSHQVATGLSSARPALPLPHPAQNAPPPPLLWYANPTSDGEFTTTQFSSWAVSALILMLSQSLASFYFPTKAAPYPQRQLGGYLKRGIGFLLPSLFLAINPGPRKQGPRKRGQRHLRPPSDTGQASHQSGPERPRAARGDQTLSPDPPPT